MPLDLSPCEVHLPMYQPTFDLTKQRFLPAKTVPTVRELVKAKQDERTIPPQSSFVNRMEDTLMRWKPPGSSYRGTTMAIEGTHPYQLATAKFRTNNYGEGDGAGGGGSYMRDSFAQWWRGVRGDRIGDEQFQDANNDDEDDEFSLANTQLADTARTPYATVPKTPQAAVPADHELSPLGEPRDLYQFYYGKPVPPDYLARRNTTFNHLQQSQTSKNPAQWIKACFSPCNSV